MSRRKMLVMEPDNQASYRSQTHPWRVSASARTLRIRGRSRSGFSGIAVAYSHGHAGCNSPAGTDLSYCLAGGSTCRRPPVWRAVVRTARSFLYARRHLFHGVEATPDMRRGLPPMVCETAYHRHERTEVNWLGDVQIETCVHGGFHVTGGGITGYRYRQHLPP